MKEKLGVRRTYMKEPQSVHFSSSKDDWGTPSSLFKTLDGHFGFTLDVCATAENAKCRRFLTLADDGLSQDWRGICWMNPPYGRQIEHWVAKAKASADDGAMVVCLLPSRTDTRWWHEYVMQAAKIYFIKGRLRFQGATNSAPFPSAIVVFQPAAGRPVFGAMTALGEVWA